jgi:hypothetical protein
MLRVLYHDLMLYYSLRLEVAKLLSILLSDGCSPSGTKLFLTLREGWRAAINPYLLIPLKPPFLAACFQ